MCLDLVFRKKSGRTFRTFEIEHIWTFAFFRCRVTSKRVAIEVNYLKKWKLKCVSSTFIWEGSGTSNSVSVGLKKAVVSSHAGRIFAAAIISEINAGSKSCEVSKPVICSKHRNDCDLPGLRHIRKVVPKRKESTYVLRRSKLRQQIMRRILAKSLYCAYANSWHRLYMISKRP